MRVADIDQVIAMKPLDAEFWPQLPAERSEFTVQPRPVPTLTGRVDGYLKANFTRRCRLPEIARGVGSSIRVMTAAFKRAHHCTIHQYLSLLRLRAAVHLLIESDLKIAAIAESVGWSSQADFYRHLRRFASLSPGAARVDKANASLMLARFDEWLCSRGLFV
jgi:transcriptional regulator GlxA family with amidase domain